MIEELAKKWLHLNYQYPDVVEVLPMQTTYGLVVYFYNKNTGKDYDWFLTIPMVQDLLNGRNPKKVKNKYKPIYADQSQFKVGVDKSLFSDRGYQTLRNGNAKRSKLRHNIFKRDGYKCLKCGTGCNLTIDHVKPTSKGGVNRVFNKQTLCEKCNNDKGDIEIDYR